MLTAEEIDDLMWPITNLYEEFNSTVICDIARRISKTGGVTATAALQAQRITESGLLYEELLDEVAKMTHMSKTELDKLFKAAGYKTMKFDDSIYTHAGLSPRPLHLSPAMTQVLTAGIEKTGGYVNNLCRTVPLAGQEAYIHATDIIHMQVSSGAMSYTQALRAQVKELAARGLTTVSYGKHVDQMDVALRRATLTGVSQTCGKLQETRADEMDLDLVQVSAHIGARPSHQLWQGKVYSRKFPTDEYPDFVTETGYGTGPGLMGWNCRHTFYPYYYGISEDHYTKKELETYQNATVPYNGKDVQMYEATQIQRKMEREIRRWKRECDALRAANLDNTVEYAKMQQARAKLRDFTKQTGLIRQREREGFKTKIMK